MSNLLIGNGLSISISNNFSYSSLRGKVAGDLSPAVQRLFNKLETDDFEHLLTKIKDAREIIEAITDGQVLISQSISDEIKAKLIEAIQTMNPRGPSDHGLDVKLLNDALCQYKNIFTTNYDIYLYWGRRDSNNNFNIIDYFFSKNKFDRNNVDKRERKAIHFLHGALFLFEQNNEVIKINRGPFPTLDQAIQHKITNENSYPLFISEGSSVEKLASIRKSEYLSFCYDGLRAMEGSLDIYGHGLNPDVDGHIIDAIKDSNITHVRYYQYNLDQMSSGEIEHLTVILNRKLNRKVEVIDTKDHSLSKLSIHNDY
ncbi:DUF4917 family protein [Thalassomonas sp. RHCl1]|uniref:DUF4917 family protein n=1 Tax=Thalassomonas sp. RHCl1 TaxID=2995320 RepID=UPI00248CA229|nr:DUF4917 family protein [Thalassomonas sp. RHCl1]